MDHAVPRVETPFHTPNVPGEVVKPPLDRERWRGCDYVLAAGGAQDDLHKEDEEDHPLQHELGHDEGPAPATRLPWYVWLGLGTLSLGRPAHSTAIGAQLTQKHRQRSNQVQQTMLRITTTRAPTVLLKSLLDSNFRG